MLFQILFSALNHFRFLIFILFKATSVSRAYKIPSFNSVKCFSPSPRNIFFHQSFFLLSTPTIGGARIFRQGWTNILYKLLKFQCRRFGVTRTHIPFFNYHRYVLALRPSDRLTPAWYLWPLNIPWSQLANIREIYVLLFVYLFSLLKYGRYNWVSNIYGEMNTSTTLLYWKKLITDWIYIKRQRIKVILFI